MFGCFSAIKNIEISKKQIIKDILPTNEFIIEANDIVCNSSLKSNFSANDLMKNNSENHNRFDRRDHRQEHRQHFIPGMQGMHGLPPHRGNIFSQFF